MDSDCTPIIKNIIFYPFYWLIVWLIGGTLAAIFHAQNAEPTLMATVAMFSTIFWELCALGCKSLKEMYLERKGKSRKLYR